MDDQVRIPANRRREVRVGSAARPKWPRFVASYRAFCIVRSIRNAIGFSSGLPWILLDQPLEVARLELVRRRPDSE